MKTRFTSDSAICCGCSARNCASLTTMGLNIDDLSELLGVAEDSGSCCGVFAPRWSLVRARVLGRLAHPVAPCAGPVAIGGLERVIAELVGFAPQVDAGRLLACPVLHFSSDFERHRTLAGGAPLY